MPKFLLTATRSYKQVCAKHLLTPPQNPHPSTTWPPCHCSFCAFSSSLNCALPRPLHTAASAATSLPCPGPSWSPSSSVQEWKTVAKSRFHSNGFTASTAGISVSPLTGKHLINTNKFGAMTLFLPSDPTCTSQLPQNSRLLCSVSNVI